MAVTFTEDLSISVKPFKIYRNFITDITLIGNSDSAGNLPKTLLFTDRYACAEFNVYLSDSDLIQGQNTITLIYDGIYKRKEPFTTTFTFNENTYTLHINSATQGGGNGSGSGNNNGENSDNAPIIQDISVFKNNRENFAFSEYSQLLNNAYYSPNSVAAKALRLNTDYSRVKFNGQNYHGEFVLLSDLNNLVFEAVDIDTSTSYAMMYQMSDENGNISDNAVFYVNVGAYSTIEWDRLVVSANSEVGLDAYFNMKYTGATGQQVTVGDVFLDVDEILNLSVVCDETKTLNGNGILRIHIVASPSTMFGTHIFDFNVFGNASLKVIYRAKPTGGDIETDPNLK